MDEKFYYERIPHYYETDQMGIIHHSNYIRWFEEARIQLLENYNLDYKTLEQLGILIPVLQVSCQYKQYITFHEPIRIYPKLETFTGLKFEFSYEIRDVKENKLKAIGHSSHCFLNKDLKPIRLKKEFPEIYQLLLNILSS